MNYERTAIFAVRSIFVLTSGYIVRILYISDMNSRDRGESLNLIISNAGDRPIYEQIYTQIKDCIISGELSEGDMLPSIRALAKDLRISVITTTRAYDELERDMSRERTMKALNEFLRPEFINRVDEVICFNQLTEENFRAIAGLMLGELRDVMKEKNIALTWDDSLVDYLVKKAYSVTYGARTLRRTIQKDIEDVLAQRIVENRGREIKSIAMSAQDGAVTIAIGE